MNAALTSMRLEGWDHYSAIMLIFVLLVAALLLLMAVASLVGVKFATILTVGPPVLALLVAPFLRYEITGNRAGIRVCRLVLRIPYSREHVETNNVWVQVWGTGDWGEAGGWPANCYCMIGQERPTRRERASVGPRTHIAWRRSSIRSSNV